jgi:hypothetical protein
MPDIAKIADAADLIVNGYAFTRCELGYRVLNLNCPEHAMVISADGDIEIQIVKDYFAKNKKFMEED